MCIKKIFEGTSSLVNGGDAAVVRTTARRRHGHLEVGPRVATAGSQNESYSTFWQYSTHLSRRFRVLRSQVCGRRNIAAVLLH